MKSVSWPTCPNLILLGEKLEKAIDRVLNNCGFILGDEVSAFENQFCQILQCSFCIGVANGTDAITIAF